MGIRRFVQFFRLLNLLTCRQVILRAQRHRLVGLATEIAFNSVLALFPALLALVTAIGLFLTWKPLLEPLMYQLSQVAPDEVMVIIRGFVYEVQKSGHQSWLSLSFLASLWVASGAMSAAMSALDQIHRIPHRRQRPFVKAKLVSLLLTIGTMGLLALASFGWFVGEFVIQILVSRGDRLIEILTNRSHVSVVTNGWVQLWRVIDLPLTLVIVAIAVSFVYRFAPSRWQHGTPIFPGAVLASVSWAGLSYLFRLYVANFGNYNRIYGAVGAVIVLLLWLQLSALMMLIGSQLNVVIGDAMQQRSANTMDDRCQQTEENQTPENTTWHKGE